LFAFVLSSQRFVTGFVKVKLFKGRVAVAGRKSEFSLYSKKLATYETGDQFNHDAAKGFIWLHGLGQQTQAKLQLLKDDRGFELPGLLRHEK
jgi:argininosuccinate synthase